MRLVTERPEAIAAMLPPEWSDCRWEPLARGHAPTRRIWEALGGRGTPTVADLCAVDAGQGVSSRSDDARCGPAAARRRLAPAPLPASALASPTPPGFWSHLVLLAEASRSPFDVLFRDLSPHLEELGPVACAAISGRDLHGQRGRHWVACSGNLHLSVAVPLRLVAAPNAAALSMLPAVATVDAIDAATRGSVRAGIKWVGDVLVDGRKVAGSLTATRVLRGEIDTAVFGVGLNVSVVPDVPPTPFVPVAGCLRQHPGGTHLTLGGVLRQVLHALETRVTRLRAEGPAPLASDYRRASIVVGRRVRIWDDAVTSDTDPAGWPAPLAAGLIIDVGSDLRLTLQGRREPIDRGRLAFEDACARFGI